MDARDAIKNNIETADMVCGAYLEDLTDAEAMTRPHAGCNHVNWQIGHLIQSDNQMFNGCFPDALPALPEGFSEKYSKETATVDDPSKFIPKSELMDLYRNQRKAILEKVATLSGEDLAKPSPESMQSYAPNVLAALNMVGSHWMMHAGQFVVVRRQLGREIVI